MERPGIKECWSGRAEPSPLVELVESNHPILPVLFLGLEKPHGHTHPEKLRCFDSSWLGGRLVDYEITIVQGLDS